MRYMWDPAKQKANIEKHGLDFSLAERIINATAMRDVVDDRTDKNYGEERHLAYAEVNGVKLCLCYVSREPDIIRPISLRRAHEKEWRKLKW